MAVRLGNQSTDTLTVHKQSWQSRCLFLQYYRGKKPFILRFRTARIKYRSYPARAQASSKKKVRAGMKYGRRIPAACVKSAEGLVYAIRL